MTQRTQIAGWDRLFYGIDKMNERFASETLAGKWTKRDATSVRNLVGVILACDS